MAVRVNAGFDLFSKQPLDSRFVFDTKADLLDFAKYKLYDGLISYCIEDNLFYKLVNDNWEELDQMKDAINKPVNSTDLPTLTGIVDGSIVFVKDEHRFYYYVAPANPDDVQPNEGFQPLKYNANEIIYTDASATDKVDNVQDAIDRNIANIKTNTTNIATNKTDIANINTELTTVKTTINENIKKINKINDVITAFNYKATVETEADLVGKTFVDGDVVTVLNKETTDDGLTVIDPKIFAYFDGGWVQINKVSADDLLSTTDKDKLATIKTDGDGTKYLADDGTYKLITGGTGSTVIDWAKDPTTVTVGGISAGYTTPNGGIDLADFIYEMTHPFVYPTLSVELVDDAGIFEIGTAKTLSKIIVKSTGGSLDAFASGVKPEILINGVAYVPTSTEETLTDTEYTVTLGTTKSYDGTIGGSVKAKVTVKDKVIEASAHYSFVCPMYVGSSDTDVMTDVIITSGTKLVKEKSNVTSSFTCTNQYSFFAYDASWGNI